jgi:hypothetical protein
MAFSGHKTPTEVQRYTEAANKKRLADSGSAKIAAQDQGENASYTNIAPQLHKQAPSH